MTTVGWVLNLDADLELADPANFAPSKRAARQTAVQAERFLAAANRGGADRVRHVRLEPGIPANVCQAWCPTPGAGLAAHAIGHALPAMPPLAVIQGVNHRAFAAGLGSTLPGAAFVTTMAELDAALAAANPRDGWLLKRPFGFSGRSRKRVRSRPEGAERRWAEASMTGHGRGLQVEPFATIDREFALHSWLDREGDCIRGRPTRMVTDADGAWLRNEPFDDRDPNLSDDERNQLENAHIAAARALAAAGYFGPFSTDAFRWHDAVGRQCFQPLSEVNARYTMGFFVGLCDRQPEWLAQIGRGTT